MRDHAELKGRSKQNAMVKWLLLALLPLVALGLRPTPATAETYTLTPQSNAQFLADFAKRPDVVKLPDGLMYRVLEKGNGTSVQKNNDVVTVYYRGALINGAVFDQTKPDEPRQFLAGGVIPGWVEALKKMTAGDMWEIVIPAALGYGEDGVGDAIPPNQTLVFVVKLEKVEYAP